VTSSREEVKRELLLMDYRTLVLEYKNLKNLHDHYDAAVRFGLIKDLEKWELYEVIKLYREAIREKERDILRNAFLRGRG